MKSIVSLVSIVVLLASCATTHPGSRGELQKSDKGVGQDLTVSVELVEKFSDAYHAFYVVTLENEGEKWARFKWASLKFKNSSTQRSSKVLRGKDLQEWIQATDSRLKKENLNSSLTYGGIMLGGLLLNAFSRNRGGKAVGAGMALGGAAGMAGQSVGNARRQAQTGSKTNKDYLVGQPISVPAGAFVRKWVVVKVKDTLSDQDQYLELTDKKKRKARFLIAHD